MSHKRTIVIIIIIIIIIIILLGCVSFFKLYSCCVVLIYRHCCFDSRLSVRIPHGNRKGEARRPKLSMARLWVRAFAIWSRAYTVTLFNVVCQNYCRDTSVLASTSSELFLPALAFIHIWWITLPNSWVCCSILYHLLFFSLPLSFLPVWSSYFAFVFSDLISQYFLPLLLIVT